MSISMLNTFAATSVALFFAGVFMLAGWPSLHIVAYGSMLASVGIGCALLVPMKADERRQRGEAA